MLVMSGQLLVLALVRQGGTSKFGAYRYNISQNMCRRVGRKGGGGRGRRLLTMVDYPVTTRESACSLQCFECFSVPSPISHKPRKYGRYYMKYSVRTCFPPTLIISGSAIG